MYNQKLDQHNFSVNVKTHLFMYALANTGKCIRIRIFKQNVSNMHL